MLNEPFGIHSRLPVAVGSIKMHHLVGESKWVHPCIRDTPTVLPGVDDGKPYAAVFQPSTITLVEVLETPGGVKLADQRQLSSLMFTCVFCLLEGERAWFVEDRTCGRRRFTETYPDSIILVKPLYMSPLFPKFPSHYDCSGSFQGQTAKYFPKNELDHVSLTDFVVLSTYLQPHCSTVAPEGQLVATVHKPDI